MTSLDWVSAQTPHTDRAVARLGEVVAALGEGRLSALLCSHVEWKFTRFAIQLAEILDVRVVANVAATCRADCVAELARRGIPVLPEAGATQGDLEAAHDAACERGYDLVFDDGAHMLVRLARAGRAVRVATEFTMTGIRKLRDVTELGFPVYDLDGSWAKQTIGNRLGPGTSCLTAFTGITNLSTAGRRVGVVGFGPVGESVARAFRAADADVAVTERNAARRLWAARAGYPLLSLEELCRRGGLIVSCTGFPHTLTGGALRALADGTLLANMGHDDGEIDREQLAADARDTRLVADGVRRFDLRDGRSVYLLCDGSLINLAGGKGFAIDLFDPLLASAAAVWADALTAPPPPGLHAFPAKVDEVVQGWMARC